MSWITKIEIPASVGKFGDRCFRDSPVKELIFSPDSHLQEIGNLVFADSLVPVLRFPK
jgi:hypothetical protein